LIWLLLFPAILYTLGWLWVYFQMKEEKDVEVTGHQATSVSVLIPFRNEEENIMQLLNDLRSQTKIPEEVIWINDHSTDQGSELVMQWLQQHVDDESLKSWKCVLNNGEGKKKAIETGVNQSTKSWVITLDADVRLSDKWFETFSAYLKNDVAAVAGWVNLTGKSIAQRCQLLEFNMLLASGFATIKQQKPGMLSGAHFAFKKEVFENVNGYADNLAIASGDDEFLLRKIINKKEKVGICMHPQASVTTEASKDFITMVAQRVRWAGKWKHHRDWQTKFLAISVASLQLFWIITIIIPFFNFIFILPVVVTWLIKILGEYTVLSFLRKKWNQPFDGKAFLWMQLLYPFLVWWIVWRTTKKTTIWKGRSINI
jgi:biofilm PGA synthesis N-glycosyltransferase PgaC